jgi:hypothetical protein
LLRARPWHGVDETLHTIKWGEEVTREFVGASLIRSSPVDRFNAGCKVSKENVAELMSERKPLAFWVIRRCDSDNEGLGLGVSTRHPVETRGHVHDHDIDASARRDETRQITNWSVPKSEPAPETGRHLGCRHRI